MNLEVGPKLLELLHELVPAATIIGLLINPSTPLLARGATQAEFRHPLPEPISFYRISKRESRFGWRPHSSAPLLRTATP